MATGFQRVIEHLQQAGGGLTDGQLLGRFIAARDEAAFAALVRRHGPMVLAVCRRVAGRLPRRRGRLPGHVPRPGSQGGVAGRGTNRSAAGCTRSPTTPRRQASAANARRRGRERLMKDMPQPEVGSAPGAGLAAAARPRAESPAREVPRRHRPVRPGRENPHAKPPANCESPKAPCPVVWPRGGSCWPSGWRVAAWPFRRALLRWHWPRDRRRPQVSAALANSTARPRRWSRPVKWRRSRRPLSLS